MDNAQEVLYWTLPLAQRHTIAHKFGVCHAADRDDYPDECQRSAAWLRRLQRGGSFADAMKLAARYHWFTLRHLEEALVERRARAMRDQLEHYRDQQYRLLAYAAVGTTP